MLYNDEKICFTSVGVRSKTDETAYHDAERKTQAGRQESIAVLDFEVLHSGKPADDEVDTYYRCC